MTPRYALMAIGRDDCNTRVSTILGIYNTYDEACDMASLHIDMLSGLPDFYEDAHTTTDPVVLKPGDDLSGSILHGHMTIPGATQVGIIHSHIKSNYHYYMAFSVVDLGDDTEGKYLVVGTSEYDIGVDTDICEDIDGEEHIPTVTYKRCMTLNEARTVQRKMCNDIQNKYLDQNKYLENEEDPYNVKESKIGNNVIKILAEYQTYYDDCSEWVGIINLCEIGLSRMGTITKLYKSIRNSTSEVYLYDAYTHAYDMLEVMEVNAYNKSIDITLTNGITFTLSVHDDCTFEFEGRMTWDLHTVPDTNKFQYTFNDKIGECSLATVDLCDTQPGTANDIIRCIDKMMQVTPVFTTQNLAYMLDGAIDSIRNPETMVEKLTGNAKMFNAGKRIMDLIMVDPMRYAEQDYSLFGKRTPQKNSARRDFADLLAIIARMVANGDVLME